VTRDGVHTTGFRQVSFRRGIMRIVLTTVAISLTVGVSAKADEAAKTAAFAVYPITTEFQRVRLAHSAEEAPRLRAYVAISGNELIDGEGAMLAEALPVEQITKALAPYADREKGLVTLNMQFGNENNGQLRFPSKAADMPLRMALENMGRAAGFKSATVSSSFGGPVLEKKFATVTDKVKGRADEEEIPSGDELVAVYPVRTILSLLITDNTDCVVVVHPPLEKDGENLLSPEIREAIVKHVAKVQLRDKAKLQLSFKTRRSRISKERFDEFYRGEVTNLGKSLGFEFTSIQHSSMQ
jgi:hypothetical protein